MYTATGCASPRSAPSPPSTKNLNRSSQHTEGPPENKHSAQMKRDAIGVPFLSLIEISIHPRSSRISVPFIVFACSGTFVVSILIEEIFSPVILHINFELLRRLPTLPLVVAIADPVITFTRRHLQPAARHHAQVHPSEERAAEVSPVCNALSAFAQCSCQRKQDVHCHDVFRSNSKRKREEKY